MKRARARERSPLFLGDVNGDECDEWLVTEPDVAREGRAWVFSAVRPLATR